MSDKYEKTPCESTTKYGIYSYAYFKSSGQHAKMPYCEAMTPSKDQIKAWLKEIGQTREWLAQQCGAKSKRTVEKWFETKGIIPSRAILKITELMRQTKHQPPSLTPIALPNPDARGKMELRLDYDTQRTIEQEALRLGLTLSDYCTLAVEWCCKQPNIVERLATRLAAQQAETTTQNQGTEKQETAKSGLPSHTGTTVPASQKRTTEETLGILRLGTNQGATKKSGSA